MAAINYTPFYQRNYIRDLPDVSLSAWKKCKEVAVAILPLLSLHRTCRLPLSATLSGTRAVAQIDAAIKALRNRDMTQAAYQCFHTCLTTAAFSLLFFQPVLSYTATSASDLIHHLHEIKLFLAAGDMGSAGHAFFGAMLDGLFLGSVLYGAIEITVAFATLQILLELYSAARLTRNGKYLAGLCQGILAAAHLKQASAQYRLLQWKYETAPVLEGVLKRNDQGFVYLDIPDEQVFSLLKYCGDKGIKPPPYFKPGRAGAHISVIAAEEQTGQIPELGQKFAFRICHSDFFDLEASRIHLIAVACPELEQVRLGQGLCNRLGGNHDFHITYGTQLFV